MDELRLGLRDVIGGRTGICNFFPFSYRGHKVEELVRERTYDEVACLLLEKTWPPKDFLEKLYRPFGQDANSIWQSIWISFRGGENAHPMELLRHALSTISLRDKRHRERTEERDRAISIDLIGSFGYIVSLIYRFKNSKLPILPFKFGSLAADTFYGILEREPNTLEKRVMDVLLMLYAEHEFNLSTWGGVRVAASGDVDIYSATINGTNNLSGLLHGGANEDSMKFLEAAAPIERIGELEAHLLSNVEMVLRKKMKWKLPGFGHAVYKTGDSRVQILKPYVYDLSRFKQDMKWYELCEQVEEIMLKARDKFASEFPEFKWWFANIDFWAAPAYKLLGIPTDLYTPLFAASRIAGWCAHWMEAKWELKEKLVRPRAEYIEDPAL